MSTSQFLDYFERNARTDRAPASSLRAEVPVALHALLVASLGRFQLGESAGSRLHDEITTLRDPALDAATRRCVQLYIEEEWRHARELAQVIRALGGTLQTAHWTNAAFTACRRLIGLRTKMMTLAVAEVVGIVYYRALARRVGSPALALALERIAGEEARHLDFQAAFFEQVIACSPRPARTTLRCLLRYALLALLALALLVLWLDHRTLLRRLGATPMALGRAAWGELHARRFLRGASQQGPSHQNAKGPRPVRAVPCLAGSRSRHWTAAETLRRSCTRACTCACGSCCLARFARP